MHFTLMPVIPHYIEYDILRNNGAKIDTSYFLMLSFDFVMTGQKNFGIPTHLPPPLALLFSHLETYAKRKKSLAEQYAQVLMKESYGECTLLFYQQAHAKRAGKTLFRYLFARDHWAQIEDIFLESGLAVFRRKEETIRRYALPESDTSIEVIETNGHAVLQIKATDEDAVVEALTIVGHTIDEGHVT